MTHLEAMNEMLIDFNDLVQHPRIETKDQLTGYKLGIDLGTSSIVLVVMNEEDKPIYGDFEYANVIKDGLVVNYIECVAIVEKLKKKAESFLECELTVASSAVPPGTIGNNKQIVTNILESAGLEVDKVLDEPTAAATFLNIQDGAVIDVGGGTTGISIFEKGQPIIVEDEATGGTHMSLVIAGHHKLSYEEAELMKRKPEKESENLVICQPVIQKMAAISEKVIRQHPVSLLYVVGGASFLPGFEKVFGQYLKQTVYKPAYPQFVTPIGIAMNSELVLCGEEDK